MHYTEMYLQSQVEYYKKQVERVRELCKQDDLDIPVILLASDVLDALDGEK